MRTPRALVTGLGVISPNGTGLQNFWESCVRGRSGIGVIPGIELTHDPPVRVAGRVTDFSPSDALTASEVRRTSRHMQFAAVAIDEAIRSSNLDLSKVDPERVSLCLGNAIGSISDMVAQVRNYDGGGWRSCDPFVTIKSFPYMTTSWLTVRLGIRGHASTSVTACTAGTEAIGTALNLIRAQKASVVIAGGTEAWLDDCSLAGFALLRAFTKSSNPSTASRPFDKDRDGCVPGEGAAFVVIEDADHALGRDATILGEIAGFAANCDGYNLLAPRDSGEDAARCIAAALVDAGLSVEDVDLISSHATSTVRNDASEAAAIMSVFGDGGKAIPVTALKSMTGHCLAASGAIETLATIMSINTGIIPPVVGLTQRDPRCELDLSSSPRTGQVHIAVKNSFALGGHNACLVIRKYVE